MPEPNPLWAEKEPVDPAAGTIVEDINAVYNEIVAGEADFETVLDGIDVASSLGDAVINPFDFLLAQGLGWAVEHFQPLTDAVNKLAGDPGQIDAYAKTWNNVSRAMTGSAQQVDVGVRNDLKTWHGKASDGYRTQAAGVSAAMKSLSTAAAQMEKLTGIAQKLVDWARGKIIELAIDAVIKLKQLLTQLAITLAFPPAALVTVPLAEARVAALAARYSALLARLFAKLAKAGKVLGELLGKLSGLLDELVGLLDKIWAGGGGKGRGKSKGWDWGLLPVGAG